jgi:hypothetical protein
MYCCADTRQRIAIDCHFSANIWHMRKQKKIKTFTSSVNNLVLCSTNVVS